MSLEIRVTIICDGCGERINAEPEHRSTSINEPLWEAKQRARLAGWTAISGGRCNPRRHYCKVCSDKAPKPVPRKRKAEFKFVLPYDPSF